MGQQGTSFWTISLVPAWPIEMLSCSLPDDLFQEWIDFFPLREDWNVVRCLIVDSQAHDLAVRPKFCCQSPCLVHDTSAIIFRPVQNQCRGLDLVGVP